MDLSQVKISLAEIKIRICTAVCISLTKLVKITPFKLKHIQLSFRQDLSSEAASQEARGFCIQKQTRFYQVFILGASALPGRQMEQVTGLQGEGAFASNTRIELNAKKKENYLLSVPLFLASALSS